MPARLHHERIARGEPARWLALVHGIYGSGTNWRTVARQLVERRPEWGALLVDLRLHGRSEAGEPPHSLDACAGDLRALFAELALPVAALAGHSFGGKVALAARARDAAPRQTWVLDATPSARPGELADPGNDVARILGLLEELPRTWARRDDFVAALVARGVSPTTAQWLAMNVVPRDDAPGSLVLRLDPVALRELLVDYYARDLWRELADPTHGPIEVVIATRSAALSPDDRARLAAAPPHVRVHSVDAGHWLHVEQPRAVVELFARYLAE